MLTHVDLFSGIGGFALACRWAGIKTVAFCEIDPYCQKVLEKQFNARIITNTNGIGLNGLRRESGSEAPEEQAGGVEALGTERFPAIHPDIFTFDGRAYPSPFILTGGFPCQPFSCAGKRRGKEDDRHLWPEMLRVISEARPTWVIGENVAGIVKMELDNCISDLEGLSYSVQAFIIPACAVDAPHRRDRVWIIARDGHVENAKRERSLSSSDGFGKVESEMEKIIGEHTGDKAWIVNPSSSSKDVADADRQGPQGHGGLRERGGERTLGPCRWTDEAEWFALTGLGRVAHGVPQRVDRLKSLGNAVCPPLVFELVRSIVEIETS